MARQTRRLVMGLILALGVMLASVNLNADSILGVPVTGLGPGATQAVPTCNQMEGQVCYNASTGSIKFFIPLSDSKRGTYGVTNVGNGKTAGTTPDTGDGTENALTMYLKFSPIVMPVSAASLSFLFTDLDLRYVNDPAKFLETVRFYNDAGNPITPVIRTAGQSGVCSQPSCLAYFVSGNSNTQTIFFPDVTSILESPFYIRLNFTSAWNQNGTNTPEFLVATLNTTPLTRVPEPGTLVLLGFGMGIAGLMARRK